MTHSQLYLRVINSARWRALKQRVIKRRGRRCQRCHADDVPIELHHKTYARLGRERAADVELLCLACHEIADKQRAADTVTRVYFARVNGWARKKYGDDWAQHHDVNTVAEEFDRWLAKKKP